MFGSPSTTSTDFKLRLTNALRLERVTFAAKVRAARAILGLTQAELGVRVGLTQKSVHRIEQGAVESKRRTRRIIEQFWRENAITFEDPPDGGFRIVVQPSVLTRD